jgi:hypothetical protein
MSQAHVEQILGRLATDAHWRTRFQLAPDATLDALAESSALDVTVTERRALLALPGDALDRFADALDPRLQRSEAAR